MNPIAYTRKDGQYLRWDYRSGRRQGKKIFDKGEILTFDKAITDKLHQIDADLLAGELPDDLFATTRSRADIMLHGGSCLEILPKLKANSYDCIITSPPYCNRYDYTRTTEDADIELNLRGISWQKAKENRTLVYNRKVPFLGKKGKNVDLCLFSCDVVDVAKAIGTPSFYVALGELKGGIATANCHSCVVTCRTTPTASDAIVPYTLNRMSLFFIFHR